MPVQSYFSVVRRYWKLLAAITLIPTVIAVIMVLFVIPPLYEGKTTVIVPLMRASSLLRQSLSNLDVPMSGMANVLEAAPTVYNYIAIIESRSLAQKVYDYLLNEKGIDLLPTYPKIARDPDIPTREEKLLALAGRMQKRVQVDDSNRGVAEVTYRHTDPLIAAEVANAYVSQTLAFLNDLNHSTQSDLVTFLTARQSEVEQNLSTAETEIERVKEETGILSVEEQAAQLIKSYSDIEALVAKAEIDYEGSLSQARNMQKAGLDMQDYYSWLAAGENPESGAPAPDVEALGDATIAQLRSQLDALELQRQRTLLYATPENPEVIALNSQIESLQRELYREFSDYYDAAVAGLMVESSSYQAQLSVAKNVLGELDQRLNAFPPDERRLIELQRDRDVQESIYLVITQELEQAHIQEMREDTPFTVLDEALVPTEPVRPRKLIATVGTMAVFFWIGILVIFSIDADRRRAAARR